MSNNQGQHIIPIVYLKQFGFLKNKQQMICVWNLGEHFIRHKSIESFNKQYNIFDLPFNDLESRRLLEQFNGELETHYPNIISDLENTGKLSLISEAALVQIIPNFLCRTTSYRQILTQILQSEHREAFLGAMCKGIEDTDKRFISKLVNLSIQYQVNIVLFFVINHLVNRLAYFHYTIIKDYENRGWPTCDNLVCIKDPNNTFLSIDSEIFFPLSKDYCIYLHNVNSKDTTSLFRKYPNKKLINSDEPDHKKIWDHICYNASQYVIFPTDLPKGLKLNEK